MLQRLRIRRLLAGLVATLVLLAALAGGPLLVSALTHRDGLPTNEIPHSDHLSLVWSQMVPGYQSASLSPDNMFLGMVSSASGKVSLWHQGQAQGRLVWKRLWTVSIPGVTEVEVGPGGRDVLAYALLKPEQPAVSHLNGADGAVLSANILDGGHWDQGAIWALALAPDGVYAAVLTGRRGLYLYTMKDRKLRDWKLDGLGTSAAFAPDDAFLTVGTWDNSGVSCFALSGTPLWLYPTSPDRRQALTNRLFATSVSQNGRSVLALSYANARQGDATLALWRSDGAGTPLWTQDLGSDAFFPKAVLSADGARVAVSYLRVITRGDQSLAEHRLRLLDSRGNVLWEKGGLLFSPSLIALAPDGKRLTVSDSRNTLYTLNDEGRIMAHTALGGAIRDTRPSADGRFLLVYTGDGVLSLLRYD